MTKKHTGINRLHAGLFFMFLSSADFFQNQNSFKNAISVSNILDQDPDRRSVGPDLDSNCLQRL